MPPRTNQDFAVKAIVKITEVFEHIPAHQQREFMRFVLHKAILIPDCMRIAL